VYWAKIKGRKFVVKFIEGDAEAEAEIRLMKAARIHEHVVPQVARIMTLRGKILVYNFMCGGNLHDRLHDAKSSGRAASNLQQRILIARDIARVGEVPPPRSAVNLECSIKTSSPKTWFWTARMEHTSSTLVLPCEISGPPSGVEGTLGYMDDRMHW